MSVDTVEDSEDTVEDSEVKTVQELSGAAVAESGEAPVRVEAGTCDKTGHSYRAGEAVGAGEGAGAGVKRVVFRLGKQVLGQASFLSDTEEEEKEEEKGEEKKENEEEERLVMDFPEDEEEEEGALFL